jgi:hypothetical protein
MCHPVMMNDTHPPQHAKEEISGTPTFFAEDPRLSLSSRFDENQLNPSLDQQFNKLNFHGRNSTTISADEKSFKDDSEEHIYVSIFPPSESLSVSQNDRYFLILDRI